MSILIDKIKGFEDNTVKIGDRWYIAKPLAKLPLKVRIKDSFKVLKGKAIAVHFKEDE